MMHRFFVEQIINSTSVVIADAAQLHHLRDVLRLKPGDEVMLIDASGAGFVCAIESIDKERAVLAVKSRREAAAHKAHLTIACAIPKKGEMDDIIDKLTQLGVDAIIPLITERVVIRLDSKAKEARVERWRRIALSAAGQSQRSDVPVIEPVAGLAYVLSRAPDFDLALIPTLEGERQHIKQALEKSAAASILALIGPEGDFTPEEVQMARDAGFVPVSLGDTVLRVATAAEAVAAFIHFYLV